MALLLGTAAKREIVMNASPDSRTYFGCTQRALAPITNKYRIRMDHLLDLATSFHLELFEGSDTQL